MLPRWTAGSPRSTDAESSEALMEKCVGFDIDNHKTIACVVQKEPKEQADTFPSKVEALRRFLLQREKEGNHTAYAANISRA